VPDLADARWFAADLHVPDRRFGMLRLDDELVSTAAFLDTRLPVALARAAPLAVAAVPAKLPRAPVGWLFHTSFCGSTLLARALHVPPYAVALKEPLVLRRLADARKSGWPLDGLVDPAVRLLARPWHEGGGVVIKPTHVALVVAAELLAATPDRRALVLTSALDDFLISNLKKPPDSQAKIPLLVDRALRATELANRLPAAALAPPDLICAAGLQWAAQREHVCDLQRAVGGDRLRTLDASQLYTGLPEIAWQVARWLDLPVPREAIVARAAEVGTRNAKELTAAYSADQRAREATGVAGRFAGELARARAWLERHVLPAMDREARADPPTWE
jgi:hypothetical protein